MSRSGSSPNRMGSYTGRARFRGDSNKGERRPLLGEQPGAGQQHEPSNSQLPLYSCFSNPHSHLPVYTNIHRIRRDITSVVEDYLSLAQLRDVRINITVIRPLVDKLYELDDISIVYCLLVNRAQFLYEQSHRSSTQNVHFSRATLCELIATRILRRFSEDNPGKDGLIVLSNILVAGFGPFQNAPESIRRQAQENQGWIFHRPLPALEIAILTESKHLLSSGTCQKVTNAIYEGRVTYTPAGLLDLIPDHYKQKPISLYDPREAPLLNQYRLIVPRTRNILEVIQYIVLMILYVVFMAESDYSKFSTLEMCFSVYAFGWCLEQFATILGHGWDVYTQNLWSFLDVGFLGIYVAYLILRVYGGITGESEPGRQAIDVIAIAAPVLIPRLAFNLLSDSMVFLSLRAMMGDFAILTALSAWCFAGFLISLQWLSPGSHDSVTTGKWMLWIWFGLDGTGIQRSAEFHWLLGPALMVAFAFLGNTLFLTIFVSILSHTFATIVTDAAAEIQYRKAVVTLEGVKSDAIFAYQPPFNILAMVILVPLRFIVSPRWFHKIHVTSVRLVNLPLLIIIAVLERRILWSSNGGTEGGQARSSREPKWFWERWNLASRQDIRAVFEMPPPDAVEEIIAVDDDLTHQLIRKQYTRRGASVSPRPLRRRRDSTYPGLAPDMRGSVGESDEAVEIEDVDSRLSAVEAAVGRVERMLEMLCSRVEGKRKLGTEDTGDSQTLRDFE
ncbi:related to YVC1 Vacuolar cation channel [Cephalotrichum gorgonifer]|uniref:Related to YVC1 Vacuolar cation channel n=1 Tax=Cephalotrichum gorgonifer TaxID=2041049 RepID=A0AAE8MNY6_9PEZI|nr:related to YVC1 Vacuolar cation channel [Cephalotrichum gorgonifer]